MREITIGGLTLTKEVLEEVYKDDMHNFPGYDSNGKPIGKDSPTSDTQATVTPQATQPTAADTLADYFREHPENFPLNVKKGDRIPESEQTQQITMNGAAAEIQQPIGEASIENSPLTPEEQEELDYFHSKSMTDAWGPGEMERCDYLEKKAAAK